MSEGPTEVISFLQNQVAHRFTVSVNKEKSMKRNCLISGSLLCIDEAANENALTLFLPQFKIVFKPRNEHYTVFVLSQIQGYTMNLRIKSKKEDETQEFYEALCISRDLYRNFVTPQDVYPVTVKGTEGMIPANLVIFETSFELQAGDGILLFDESLSPHPDVYASTDNPLMLNNSRNGVIMFSFTCCDMTELAHIILSLNNNGPAKKRVKHSRKKEKNHDYNDVGIEKKTLSPPMLKTTKEFIQTNHLNVIHEDDQNDVDLPSISESITESTTSMTAAKKLSDFKSLFSNRSAFRHLREGAYKSMFQKKRVRYGKGVQPNKLAANLSMDSQSEFGFIPDVQIYDDATSPKLLKLSGSSFEQKMINRLEKFDKRQREFSKSPSGIKTLESVIYSYRILDKTVEQNPTPKLDFTNQSNQPDYLLEKNIFTDELFNCSNTDCSYNQETIETKISLEEANQFLHLSNVSTEKYKIKSSGSTAKVFLDALFFTELGKAKPSDLPAFFATALLHGAVSVVHIYNALTCLPFSVSEVNSTLSDTPFTTFAECCVFFDKLIKLTATSHFFVVIGMSESFKSKNYFSDALIFIPGFFLALSSVEPQIGTNGFSKDPIPMYYLSDLSIVLDEYCHKYQATKTFSWLQPFTKSSTVSKIVYTISSFYLPKKDIKDKIWEVFTKTANSLVETEENKKVMEIFKECQTSKIANYSKYIRFVLVSLIAQQFVTWFVGSWKVTANITQSKTTDDQVIFFATSLIKLQNAMQYEVVPEIDSIAEQISILI